MLLGFKVWKQVGSSERSGTSLAQLFSNSVAKGARYQKCFKSQCDRGPGGGMVLDVWKNHSSASARGGSVEISVHVLFKLIFL